MSVVQYLDKMMTRQPAVAYEHGGLVFVPRHYTRHGKPLYVAPGYGFAHKRELTEQMLLRAGAKPVEVNLWPRVCL